MAYCYCCTWQTYRKTAAHPVGAILEFTTSKQHAGQQIKFPVDVSTDSTRIGEQFRICSILQKYIKMQTYTIRGTVSNYLETGVVYVFSRLYARKFSNKIFTIDQVFFSFTFTAPHECVLFTIPVTQSFSCGERHNVKYTVLIRITLRGWCDDQP